MKNFNLKKVKIHDEMSEETMCFSAQLWMDDNHIADVSNRGHGGSNDFYVHKPYSYKDIAEFDTLNGEVAIFEEADRIDQENRIIKIHQSNSFVLKKDDKIFKQKFPKPITKLKKARNYSEWRNAKVRKFKCLGYEILNTNLRK